MKKNNQPRILVVTSCTGEKVFKPDEQLGVKDFENKTQLAIEEKRLSQYMCSAAEMYTGMQHLRLMEGINLFRKFLGEKSIDVNILSAGYGLIVEDRSIAPYEVTFNNMKGHEVDAWSKHLRIREDFEKAVRDYDLVFLLLGENYLRSLNLPVFTRPDQTFIFLASQSSRKWIKGLDAKTYVLGLSNADAKKYSYGLVGLKGFLFKKFAEVVVQQPELLSKLYAKPEEFPLLLEPTQDNTDQLELTLGVPSMAVKSSKKKGKSAIAEGAEEEEESSEFLPIPDLPPAPNLHLGMKYFIPEWDDHVDPTYNFLTDTLTPDRDPHEDEVYAHEIYPTPNYDAILVSKVVVEASKKKRQKIEEIGIHKFIRFQGEVMGDCGAFGYIKEDVPPYNTIEILDYYEKLGFNYGVSIDHLIVGPFAEVGVREMRYELTLKNAQEFIDQHRLGGYTFTPIGAAQGWSPETYAEAVKQLSDMGYDYIALGGLARATSKDIIEILKAIHPHLQPHVRIHLFGVARISAIPVLRHLGVTSFDSASPLRRAWLGSGANYHTLGTKMYSAVRIPPVSRHGVRIKRVIEAGVSDSETLQKLEKGSLLALREYDRGIRSLDDTLPVLLEYSTLIYPALSLDLELKAYRDLRLSQLN